MKKSDWFFSLSLIVMGLGCVVMSAVYVSHPEGAYAYVSTVLKICIWFTVPGFLYGVIYMLIKLRGRNSNK